MRDEGSDPEGLPGCRKESGLVPVHQGEDCGVSSSDTTI